MVEFIHALMDELEPLVCPLQIFPVSPLGLVHRGADALELLTLPASACLEADRDGEQSGYEGAKDETFHGANLLLGLGVWSWHCLGLFRRRSDLVGVSFEPNFLVVSQQSHKAKADAVLDQGALANEPSLDLSGSQCAGDERRRQEEDGR